MNTSTGGNGAATRTAVESTGSPAAAPVAGSSPATGPASSATSTAPGGNTAADKPPASSPWQMIVPILLMFGVLYFVLFRGQRKEEKRRKGLIAELKKGDRVMTIGGMMARVVSIDGDEVVLKIDESANVKATYRKSSIQEVIDREK
jgi:preprotein translocase subunit YajC